MDNNSKTVSVEIFKKNNILHLSIFILAFIPLYIAKSYNYLLFHNIAEIATVSSSFLIFVVVISVWKHLEHNNYISFLGIAFFFIGFIDLIHTLAYKGMPIFYEYKTDISIQLWIVARYLESISLLTASLLIRKEKQINKHITFSIFTGITITFIIIIFRTHLFPECFEDGYGLTGFKIISEYIVCIILIASCMAIWKNRNFFKRGIFFFIILSNLLKIISEIFFTSYVAVYGFSNFMGHCFKILSIVCFCRAILDIALASPSKLIYDALEKREYELEISNNELRQTNAKLEEEIIEREEIEKEMIYLSYHDQLTGLYNRRFFEEELTRLDVQSNIPITIVMGDVNGLKLINDSFGHTLGDELLKKATAVIAKGCRAGDIIARLGGDEFVLLMTKTDSKEAEKIIKRINDIALDEKVGSINISISFGFDTKNNQVENIRTTLKNAEDNMYKKKLFESPSIRAKTINVIRNALYEKNAREEQHSCRVSELCRRMGEAMRLEDYKIGILRSAGLLHDIGKIAIEEDILNKPEKLTDEEWEHIKRHPEIGYRILSTVNEMSEVAEYVLAHHESWNGKGYPKGLAGNKIPVPSRIISIAGAYDAMTSERSYKRPLEHEAAVTELRKNAGTQFDPELVDVFVNKVLG